MPRFPLFPRLVSLAFALVLSSCDDSTPPTGGTGPLPQVSPPEFSLRGGVYYGGQDVVVSSATAGAKLHITFNGEIPSASTLNLSGPIRVDRTQTIRVIAMKDGMEPSVVRSESYTIQPIEWTYDIPWKAGISYGVLSYGGQTYRTVRIGSQNWMAENLNAKGSGLDTVGVCYHGVPASCDKYGRLYTWVQAMSLPDSCASVSCASQIRSKHQGICPPGWHLPTDDEWSFLDREVGKDSVGAGAVLKSSVGWTPVRWNEPGNGTDTYGFRALPAGSCTAIECWSGGSQGVWWTATEDVPGGIHREMEFSSSSMPSYVDGLGPYRSHSVRCLENQ
ncbi:MAG: chitobiase/beta-hexosaminidase C-terminal domain-containing protein [Fibrobacterota bacterium]|nr:chitobiase/beta-hexosaminidase C-terminal domain-containing protein [Fibrobacterota bacterium]QQS05537.1 MAG: chitobiase/beta-hexosaminidase C-terminal domain-containing protein [Fibrobacterota bacterium]